MRKPPIDPSPVPLVEVLRRSSIVATPFNARTTIHKPSHFPCPFDVAGKNEYRFITEVGAHRFGARVCYRPVGRELDIRIYSSEPTSERINLDDVHRELLRRMGATLELPGYSAMWKADSILCRLPHRMLGARPSSPFSLYEFLVICTLLQNTTVKRTVQMADALARRLGTAFRFPDGGILRGFWRPNDAVKLGESRLRDLRLGYRARSLARLSEQFATDPMLERRLLDAPRRELRSELLQIYGIGPASAGYVLFEWFKCVDEMAHVSPWERQILARLLFKKSDINPRLLLEFCRKRWAPYTMLATHAIFEAVFWRRAEGDGPEWLDELIRL